MRKFALITGIMLTMAGSGFGAAGPTGDKPERSITVQGQGKASAVPDIATVSIEVSRDGSDLDPVLTRVRREMKSVIEAGKGLGIEEKDIQTELFRVSPKFEKDKRGNPQPAGYRVVDQASAK